MEQGVKSISSIIYVEDSENDASLFLRAAQQHNLGPDITVLTSAEEAREKIGALLKRGVGLPCVILVDLTLPKESGLSLIQWLSDHSELRGVPILAISGTYKFENVDRVYDAGANVFLVKPTSPEEWEKVVHRIKKFCS